MSCQELINEFLIEYYDRQLPEAVRVDFEKHLKVCPSCVAYVEGYRRTVELARQACGTSGSAAPGGAATGAHAPRPTSAHTPPIPPPSSPAPESLVRAILKARTQ